MTEKKEFLQEQDKDNLKKLLDDLSLDISEESAKKVKDNLETLKSEIDGLKSNQDMTDFLSDVKNELSSLKEEASYNDTLKKLENNIEELIKKYTNDTKKQLSGLKNNILKEQKLSPEQIIRKAEIGRKKSSKKVEGIVGKIAQGNGFFAKIARKLV